MRKLFLICRDRHAGKAFGFGSNKGTLQPSSHSKSSFMRAECRSKCPRKRNHARSLNRTAGINARYGCYLWQGGCCHVATMRFKTCALFKIFSCASIAFDATLRPESFCLLPQVFIQSGMIQKNVAQAMPYPFRLQRLLAHGSMRRQCIHDGVEYFFCEVG